MCRAGGRRCPSSSPRSEYDRKVMNTKRRLAYATEQLKKIKAEFPKTSSIADFEERFTKVEELEDQHLSTQEKMLTEQAELGRLAITREDSYYEPPRERAVPSPEALGFSTFEKLTEDDLSTIEREQDLDFEGKIIAESLTEEQQWALSEYTAKGYVQLNRGLRDRKFSVDSLKGWSYDSIETLSHVTALDEVVSSRPTPGVQSVYRGVGGTTDELMAAKPGDVMDFPSYTSTSMNPAVASGFAFHSNAFSRANTASKQRVMMEMRTRQGFYIAGREEETILPRNTRWRVAGKRTVTDEMNGLKTIIIVQLVDEKLLDEMDREAQQGTTNASVSTDGGKDKTEEDIDV